jgi:fatty-acyl-CoA synthase
MERRPVPAWARAYLTLTLILAFLPAVVILLGAIGTKLGWWSWKTGFVAVMVKGPMGLGWAPALAALAIVAALVGLIISLWAGLWRRALTALVVGILTMGAFIYIGGQAKKAPPIHDVATDWSQPMMFSEAVMKDRGPEANPVMPDPVASAGPMAGQKIADVNAKTCPGAKPVMLAKAPADAYATARAALVKDGLKIVTDDAANGRLEAVATSFWYGFKDDVLVRVKPEGAGSRIDMRSVSRVGVSDLGQNCKRVTRLAAAMNGQASP